jgi:ectoine hydroxylase-related dioxygenase (phytanoyl-CoA dioxygenase family)
MRNGSHSSEIAEELTEGKGYAVLPGLVPRHLAERVREDILALRETDRETGRLRIEGKRERITCLLGRQHDIEQLVLNPTIRSVAERLLGPEFILSHSPSAHLVSPGAGPMAPHVDWPYWGMKPPFPITPVLTVQVIWMLEDFTLENGATRVVPGSQKSARWPDGAFKSEAVTAVGEAGSAIIAHGLIWHDTGPNISNTLRLSLLLNYGPFWVRPMSPLTGPDGEVPEAYVASASPEIRKLLGLDYAQAKMNMLRLNHARYD